MKIGKIISFAVIFIFLTICFAGSVKADKCIDDCVQKANKSGYYGKEYSSYFGNCIKQCPQKKSSGPDGFCGIKWGESRKAILESIKASGWQIIIDRPGEIQCGGLFNGQPAYLKFIIYKDSFVTGVASTAVVSVNNMGWAEISYKNIVEDLGKKYGPPGKDVINKDYLYSEWTFFNAVTKDNLLIRVTFPKYSSFIDYDRPGEYMTAVVVQYENDSLRERLRESDL